MKTADDITMVAPCGTNCGLCECHTAKDNPSLLDYLVSKGIKKELLPCPGCRAVTGNCPVLGETCATYTCATGQKIDFCFQCGEFPCNKLNPAADRANILPHNLKVFNLSCIQHQGLTRFLERSADFKKRYYQGKMAVGKGPQLE